MRARLLPRLALLAALVPSVAGAVQPDEPDAVALSAIRPLQEPVAQAQVDRLGQTPAAKDPAAPAAPGAAPKAPPKAQATPSKSKDGDPASPAAE